MFNRTPILELVTAAGFAVEREEHRDPLAHEHPTERIYVVLRAA
jgi:hypothetical protein